VKFEVVDIEWEGAFPISYNRDDDVYGLEQVPDALLDSYGFYQIYGRHPVYGNDVLLYIGETTKGKSASRSFRQRLKEHVGTRFYYHTNLSVYLGPCKFEDELVKKVESVLIFSHAPALNRTHLDEPMAGTESILVRNWSFVGSLESACTGYWDE